MQPLQNCIGPTFRIGREILCFPYVGFFVTYVLKGKGLKLKKNMRFEGDGHLRLC